MSRANAARAASTLPCGNELDVGLLLAPRGPRVPASPRDARRHRVEFDRHQPTEKHDGPGSPQVDPHHGQRGIHGQIIHKPPIG